MKSQVLCICGNRDEARKLSEMLDTVPVVLEHARTLAQARTRLRNTDFEVILTDGRGTAGVSVVLPYRGAAL